MSAPAPILTPLSENYGRKFVHGGIVVTQAMAFTDELGNVHGLRRNPPSRHIHIPRHQTEPRLDVQEKPRGTKRQRRGGLTNAQLHILSVAGGYQRKGLELAAKEAGVVTCRHTSRKDKSRFTAKPTA